MFVNRVKEVEKRVGRQDRGIDRGVHDPGLRTIRPQLSVDKAGVHLLVDFSCRGGCRELK